MEWLDIKEIVTDYGFKIMISLIILILANFGIGYVKKSLIKLLKRADVMPALSSLLGDILRFILWIMTFAIVLNVLGLKEVSLALGGSFVVIGLGLARSMSSVVGDLLAGIFLILDEDFDVGSRVDTSNIKGAVVAVDIRKTKIRDDEGNLQIVPNKKIDSSVIIIEKNSHLKDSED